MAKQSDPSKKEGKVNKSTFSPEVKKSIENLKSIKGLDKLTDDLSSTFLSSSSSRKDLLLEDWGKTGKIDNAQKALLTSVRSISRIVQGNLDLVSQLSSDGIKTTADLVKYDVATLGEKIANNPKLPQKGEAAKEMAFGILKKAEKENLSHFFLDRMFINTDKANLDKKFIVPGKGMTSFYKNNSSYDLMSESVISARTGRLNENIKPDGKVTPEFVKDVALAQQALQLSRDTDLGLLLYNKEVNVYKAHHMSHSRLMKEAGIDASTAIMVKKRAQEQHEVVMNGFIAHKEVLTNQALHNSIGSYTYLQSIFQATLADSTNWNVVSETHGLKDIQSFSDIFGSQNYCECEHCKSVLSPAAYFVDLMRFLELRVLQSDTDSPLPDTNSIHLKVRRPDLWDLELSCENTNKRIPYIGVIVEVLSKFINVQLGTSKSIEERLSEEVPGFSLSLPCNHHLESLRDRLKFYEVDRLDLLAYLFPAPTPAQHLTIALERLNLSREQYAIITNQSFNGSIDSEVLEFRKKSGMSAEVLEEFLGLDFWDGKLEIKREVDSSDLQKFKVEFEAKSGLTNWAGTFHRLYRLWNNSRIELKDIDIILKTFNIKHGSLDGNAILNVAAFLELEEGYGFDSNLLSALLNGISDDIWTSIKTFNWIDDEKISIEDLKNYTTDEAIALSMRLQAIFGMPGTEIGYCIEQLKGKLANSIIIVEAGIDNIIFSRTNINVLFRYIQIFKWTELDDFADFVTILKIQGEGTFQEIEWSIPGLRSLLSFVTSFENYNYSSAEIVSILGGVDPPAVITQEDLDHLSSVDTKTLLTSDAFINGNKFCLFYNAWLGIESDYLVYFKSFMEKSDAEFDSHLTALEAIGDFINLQPSEVTTLSELLVIKAKIERLKIITDKFQIPASTIAELNEQAIDYGYPKFEFTQWNKINWIYGFSIIKGWIDETQNLYNFNLYEVLNAIEDGEMGTDLFAKSMRKWKSLSASDSPNLITSTSSIFEINKSIAKIEWAQKLNLNYGLLDRLHDDSTIAKIKAQELMLSNSIRSSYSDNQSYIVGIQDMQNKLDVKLRDALVDFLLLGKNFRALDFGFQNVNDLYDYFLLDITMSDCFTLPKIVIATNSLQTYINRCLLGLEISRDEKYKVLLDLDEREEWEWRKNYRVWEANRKIFLFPENYAEPEIRDNKTPEFKVLEEELLQQKLNSEVVENAYKKYIHQVMSLAELKIAGAYKDGPDKIYFFGRTNTQPNEYYFRHLDILEGGGKIWSNWEKMNVSIPTKDVSALRHNGKLYVFWTTYQRQDISKLQNGNNNLRRHIYTIYLNYSNLQLDGNWSPPQSINMGFRKSSVVDPFLRINRFNEFKVCDTEINDNGKEIRENVLKEFESLVFRKPYPSTIISDSNKLSIDYIWSDKKSALLPVYRHSRAIINSFEFDVELKIVRDLWFDGEDDFTLIFPRFDQIIDLPDSQGQEEAPDSYDDVDVFITYKKGDDSLKFKLSLRNRQYTLIPHSHSGNDKYFFTSFTQVASGSFEIDEVIDYIEVNEVKLEENIIDLSEQIKIQQSTERNVDVSYLFREYQNYFDSRASYFVQDGTRDFALDSNDLLIECHRDHISNLVFEDNEILNSKLNPESFQELWRKVSVSINAILDHRFQDHYTDQIDYSESFGNYFYEIFFHIPMRIADHLNAASKFREAHKWYSYIYDPTNTKTEFERLAFPEDVNWNFTAFREIGLKRLEKIYSDPNTIEQYNRNPGNPHAIARMRISAYQKNVVMKYVDNLMDWGDYLFQQFTPDSTSEARNIYSEVESILGDKPQNVGSCKDAKALKYSDINFAANEATGEFIYNLFTKTPIYSIDDISYSNQYVSSSPKVYEKKLASQTSKNKYNYKAHQYQKESQYYHSETKRSNKGVSSSSKKGRTSGAMVSVGGAAAVVAVKGNNNRQSIVQSFEGKVIASDMLGGKASNVLLGRAAEFDKVYGRPRIPASYIDVKSDLIFCFPHNELFLKYWDRVAQRIYNLNHCLDINGVPKTMPSFAPVIDPAVLASMISGGMSFDDILSSLNGESPKYRFTYLLEKAKQYCGTAQNFGAALYSAIEKRDSEEMAQLRNVHEQNILTLSTKIRKNNLDQAKTRKEVLEESRIGIIQRVEHYASLVEEGLIAWENVEAIAKWTSGIIRGAEGISHTIASISGVLPDIGSPFAMKYGGTQLSSGFEKAGFALDSFAKVADNVAMLAGLEGGHQRREQDWKFQFEIFSQDLNGIDKQIQNADLAIALAEKDIEIHEKNIEQYQELKDFYTNKFSSYSHYTFQVSQLQTLFKMAYNLAQEMANKTLNAYNFETGKDPGNMEFIQMNNWNSSNAGLLSGETLLLQLQQLEKAFIDNNDDMIHQITQHFSVKQIAPSKLIDLKNKGEFADFEIPEAAFDLVYPGYFKRRIKSVRISIPCMVGPYTNVGAQLQLLSSKIRTTADVSASLIEDPFKVAHRISTSSAQNDGGQFDLNFYGNKYLPFEGGGAISKWALSFPNVVRAFDYNSITDVIFHVSYEAQDPKDSGAFRGQVENALRDSLEKLNGAESLRMFSLKNDFPNEWHRLNERNNFTAIELIFDRSYFPYFANVNSLASIHTKTYNQKQDGSWEEKDEADNPAQGIIISSNDMKVIVPQSLGQQNHKDIIFFIQYTIT